VTDVPPVFDPVTRSFKVRLEVDNPDMTLRPDMFVDVELLIHFPPALMVPADALVDTGQTQMVFVDIGGGFFEPRLVETGRRFGGQVEVLQGIMPGEQIVVSGNFLVDSESRIKLAAAGIHGMPARDPVCGMQVSTGQAKSAGLLSEHEGKVYHFCTEACRSRFQKHPERYVEPRPTGEQAGHSRSPSEYGHAGHAHPGRPAGHGEH
jgi:YHS domain-containing protein